MGQLKEKFNSDTELITVVARLISGYPEDVQATFTRLITDKYLNTADQLLYTRYGTRETRTDDGTIINMEIMSYLISNAAYYKKCLAYIDAEYNPVENYSSVEEETIETVYGEQGEDGSNTLAADEFKHGAHTDTHVEGFGGYDITSHTAKIKTESTPGTDTNTTTTSPYEDETFYNKEKVTSSHTMGVETVERVPAGDDGGNDIVSYDPKTNTDQYELYSDIAHFGDTKNEYEKTIDEHTDNVTRNLSRSGNIGTMTASRMLSEDAGFWKAFGWLSDMAHDIANLLSVGVWTL